MNDTTEPMPLIVRQAERHVRRLWLAIDAQQRFNQQCQEEDAAIQLRQQQRRRKVESS